MTHSRGNKNAHQWWVGVTQVLIAMWWPRPGKQLVSNTKNNNVLIIIIVVIIIKALIMIIVF